MVDQDWLVEETKPGDDNIYIVGKMGCHKVVTTEATFESGDPGTLKITLTDMKRSFPNLRLLFFDIRLGDVIVGVPGSDGEAALGVYPPGPGMGYLDTSVPSVILDGTSQILEQIKGGGCNAISALVEDMFARNPKLPQDPENEGFGRPDQVSDRLFKADYNHVRDKAFREYCSNCTEENEVQRASRAHSDPVIHAGAIATTSENLNDAEQREEAKAASGAICIERQFSHFTGSFPGLVVNGVADYADSHANPTWRAYAATTAGRLVKHSLLSISPPEVMPLRRVSNYRFASLLPRN
ncbi:hypothetical protein BDV19DRAFT_385355 [Aspergillus venezuelensis]